ncbi:MAG: transglycosylase SLT domain-containing protein [Gammaproteobacteria bacterium]
MIRLFALPALLLCLLIAPVFSLAAMSLEQQRQVYLDAGKALKAGRIDSFKKLAGSIEGYPLYPYLLYDYMRPRLRQVRDEELAGFLEQYDDLPVTAELHKTWLNVLARRKRWDVFLKYYVPQEDVALQCRQLQARMYSGGDDSLLEDIRAVWLAGESLPPVCDSAFARLYKSELMNNELVWQRIKLAMDKNNVSLAQYLSRKLSKTERARMKKWVALHHNPDRWTRNINYADDDVSRAMILHGMRRLTRVSIDKTVARWNELKGRYDFSQEQIDSLDKYLAARAAAKLNPKAITLLHNLDDDLIDERMFQWRLRTALHEKDWHIVKEWTLPPAPDARLESRRLFWQARALYALNETEPALAIFTDLSKGRGYYAFRAADHLGLEYDFGHRPLPEDPAAWEETTQHPFMLRAREFYLLKKTRHARREWDYGLDTLSPKQMQIAAAIAGDWGWYDRAIITLGRAQAYDNLTLRFPLLFEKRIKQYADKRDVDLSWMYSVVRAESAFMVQVRSPAGALGLMQVMPRTGRLTARSIGYRRFNKSMLLTEKHNVAIGSAYLRQMLDQFNHNHVLATAAYNAGPHNIMRWLPKKMCTDPEIWIETIPFKETRQYVRRILYYASIYDWRLQRDIVPVAKRIQSIPTRKQLVAKLHCEDPTNYAQQ